ncbi:MAG: phytanoyl-CoA dioxygenase family protein [Bacteroidota bacterium]
MSYFPFLSNDQVRFFHDNGYLVIKKIIAAEICFELRKRALEIGNSLRTDWDKAQFSTQNQTQHSNAYFLESGDKVRVFMEEGTQPPENIHHINKIGHALHDVDPVFEAFSHQEKWDRIARDLSFKQPGLLQSMYIFKQPRIGGAVNIHQDACFLYTDPITVVGFWFALEDTDLENGCLWALPGGHKAPLRKRFLREGLETRFEELDAQPMPATGYIPLPVPAGSLVLLHGLLPHYSEINRSDRSREAYALHIIDQQAYYPANNWLQRAESLPIRGF